jgi:hypothetical protein
MTFAPSEEPDVARILPSGFSVVANRQSIAKALQAQ